MQKPSILERGISSSYTLEIKIINILKVKDVWCGRNAEWAELLKGYDVAEHKASKPKLL